MSIIIEESGLLKIWITKILNPETENIIWP